MMYTNTGIFVENSISKRKPKSKLNRRIGKKKKNDPPKTSPLPSVSHLLPR